MALAGRNGPGRPFLYASVGPELTQYDIDVDGANLTRRGTVTLPANVHYAWPHASGDFLYVATSDSDSGIGGKVGTNHHVSAWRIDRATGALSAHGAPIPLPTRPIHMTTDAPSENILVAFSNPSGLRVYRVNPDRTPGAEVPQAEPVDPGIYAHQVRVSLDNRLAILVARGQDAAGGKPEEPGALKVFRYRDGQLTREVSVAPNGGYGFGPRHLDFHPTEPWVYVSLERQNRLDMFARDGDVLSETAAFQKGTLAEPGNIRGRQAVGTVHVHPNGRFVYVANRASSTLEHRGHRVFAGGENSIAVFAIDPASGEPQPIQHVDTHGIHCRTFHIDPSGRLLVAAHIIGLPVREGDAIRTVPATLSMFRIGPDGRLDFVRKVDVEVCDRQMFWMGMA
ncbi:MAG: beta-propeller fold lactonase family protein [Alphaproteobacteria bacterium]|nr:beta-propeller fold lactonase family protein [Alphaproteobacteria bacterium]